MKGPHRWIDGLGGSFCAAGCGEGPGTSEECPFAPTVRTPKRAPVAKPAPSEKPAKPRTEADICRDIIAAIAASGRVLVIRDEKKRIIFPHRNVQRPTPWGTFGLGAGSPDIIAILIGCADCATSPAVGSGADHDRSTCPARGRFVGIEAKKPDDPTPDEHQLAWHRQAREAGAVIIVARSADEAVAGLP